MGLREEMGAGGGTEAKLKRAGDTMLARGMEQHTTGDSSAAQRLRRSARDAGETPAATIAGIIKREEPAKPVDYNEELEKKQEERLKTRGKMKARHERNLRLLNLLGIAGCLYLAFLIWGAFMTKYQYDTDGEIKPVVMSLQQIKDAKQFEAVLAYYSKCQSLYEEVMDIDHRLALNSDDGVVIASEYNKKLEYVDSLITDITALNEQGEYTLVKTMLLNWCKNDIAVYLQNMANAISLNDSTKASNALEDRERTKEDFGIIKDNFVSLGNNLHGVDMTDIENWTVDGYMQSVNG